MKANRNVFKFLKYFFYIATNWNFKIAVHILRNEIRGFKKYKIHTTGADELKSLDKKGIDISHATIYMPASYDVLEIIFEEMQKFGLKDITDLGCGKGRPLCVAAHYGFTRLIGLDISKQFCEETNENLAITKTLIPDINYMVINNDAFFYEIPRETHCIFLFNPFDDVILEQVALNIEYSLSKYPRTIYIIYVNAMHKEVLARYGFEEIFSHSYMQYLEGSILRKVPA